MEKALKTQQKVTKTKNNNSDDEYKKPQNSKIRKRYKNLKLTNDITCK